MSVDSLWSDRGRALPRVPGWDGSVVRFMVEEDAWFDGGTCHWLDGRQEELWLI